MVLNFFQKIVNLLNLKRLIDKRADNKRQFKERIFPTNRPILFNQVNAQQEIEFIKKELNNFIELNDKIYFIKEYIDKFEIRHRIRECLTMIFSKERMIESFSYSGWGYDEDTLKNNFDKTIDKIGNVIQYFKIKYPDFSKIPTETIKSPPIQILIFLVKENDNFESHLDDNQYFGFKIKRKKEFMNHLAIAHKKGFFKIDDNNLVLIGRGKHYALMVAFYLLWRKHDFIDEPNEPWQTICDNVKYIDKNNKVNNFKNVLLSNCKNDDRYLKQLDRLENMLIPTNERIK